MDKRKLNIPMFAALILLLLTMVTTHITSGLYARYTGSASGSASARVAKFKVTGSLDKEDITVDCAQGKSGTYQITVKNDSEVTVKYSMRVMLSQDVPKNAVQVIRDDQEPIYATQKMEFADIEQLAPGETGLHTLGFGIMDWKTVTEKATNKEKSTWKLDFTVEIIAEQVD